MTDALRKMVEAMAAEIARQAEAENSEPLSAISGGAYFAETMLGTVNVRAEIDLEKVARTALRAIRQPSAFMAIGGADIRKDNGRTDQIWTEMVDRALGEDALSRRVAAGRAEG